MRRNDSLYAIAWRYKLNYRDLARRNGIEPPYTIYPGQKLVLHGMKSEPTVVAEAPRTRPSTPTAKESKPEVAERKAPSPARPAASPVAKRAPRPQPKQPVATPAPQPQPKPPAAQKTTRSQPARAGWRWPVNAQPARGFGRGNNGLDYVVASGQQVVAAGAGQVVYAGPGLGGYRHLIIVEHSDQYLSAYNINVPARSYRGKQDRQRREGCATSDRAVPRRAVCTSRFAVTARRWTRRPSSENANRGHSGTVALSSRPKFQPDEPDVRQSIRRVIPPPGSRGRVPMLPLRSSASSRQSRTCRSDARHAQRPRPDARDYSRSTLIEYRLRVTASCAVTMTVIVFMPTCSPLT